jgi:predicted CXXCH cytochrome family protein
MMEKTAQRQPSLPLLVILLILALPAGGLAAGHDDASCRGCHAGGVASAADPSKCLQCHAATSTATTAGFSFHAGTRKSCVDCHRFHDADVIATSRGDVSLAGLAGVDREHCRACHRSGARRERLSAGHLAAAGLYHANTSALAPLSPSAACRACHDRDSASSSWLGAVEGRLIVLDQHQSHPCEIAVRPGQATIGSWIRDDIDPRLVLPGGRIECVTCHDLTAGTPGLLVSLGQPADLCLGCHLLKKQAAPAITALALTTAKNP